MEFILMHKDAKVLRFVTDGLFDVKEIVEIYHSIRVPFPGRDDDLTKFREWWNNRAIPVTRDEYKKSFSNLPKENSLSLMVKARALSLTDQYWIKRVEEIVAYEDVSFFTNDYSNDIGNIFMGCPVNGKISYNSPDSTTGGDLKKYWKSIGGINYLYKAGTKPHQYEIFNEIIASKIMDILGIDHVEYEFAYDNKAVFARSKNFVSYNEDFVSAEQLYNYIDKEDGVSDYDHLLKVAKKLEIKDYQSSLDQMLFIDYLIGNTDRQLNNFGAIRKANTLNFVRMAPIYDCGSSLGYNLFDKDLMNLTSVDWLPFKTKKKPTQLSYISDFSWLNTDALQSIPQQIDQFLKGFSNYISNERRKAITNFLIDRINRVYRHLKINKETSLHSVDLSALEEDILFAAYCEGGKFEDINKLADELGLAYITVYRSVNNLTKNGLLLRKGSRKNGYWILP